MPKTFYDRLTPRSFFRSSWWEFASIPTGNPQIMINSSGYRLVGQERKSGYYDTDWRVKVKKRVDASSGYFLSKWEYLIPHHCQGSGSSRAWNSTWKRYDYFVDTFRDHDLAKTSQVGLVTSDSTLCDQALARFKRKLSGRLGNAEALVPLVELRELRGLVRSSAELTNRTLTLITPVIRKNRGLKLLSALQDYWLTYSFAIKPMVSDTIAVSEAIKSYLDLPTKMHRISASAERSWVNGTSQEVPGYHGWSQFISANVYNTLRYSYSSGIDFDLVCGNNYGMISHLGLEDIWAQVPGVAYELLPFSWVLDYFSTVGEYLNDTFVLPPGSTKYLTLTRTYTGLLLEQSAYGLGSFPSSLTDHQLMGVQSEPGRAKFVQQERTVLSQLPHRSVRFKTTDELASNAVSKLLNLGSLLRFQATERSRR